MIRDRSPSGIPPVGHLSDRVVQAPDGSEVRLLVGEAEHAARASLCVASLAPDQTSRGVWHKHVEEIWYFLDGRGLVWRCPPETDPTTVAPVEVNRGDALVIPPGWFFQFRSSPDGPLRFLCYTSPPWPGPEEAAAAPYGGLGEPSI